MISKWLQSETSTRFEKCQLILNYLKILDIKLNKIKVIWKKFILSCRYFFHSLPSSSLVKSTFFFLNLYVFPFGISLKFFLLQHPFVYFPFSLIISFLFFLFPHTHALPLILLSLVFKFSHSHFPSPLYINFLSFFIVFFLFLSLVFFLFFIHILSFSSHI